MTNNATRTVMSIRNISATFFGKMIGLVLNFVGRTVFLQYLGTEYLGLGGLFNNIFSIISLCELGFGAAITQSLYKPMALGDELEVCRIVRYFERVYSIVAFVTATLGVVMIPFLDVIVGEGQIEGIDKIYLLFLLHSVVSYLYMPKRTLVVCDQRLYIVTITQTVFAIIILAFQIIVLKLYADYLLYMIVKIILLAFQGFVINVYVQKKYTFLSKKSVITKEYKLDIHKKVKALILHKAGGIMTHSTDSILISYFLGLECMGLYSNYALIVSSVGTLIDIVISSVGASVGNLGATSSKSKSENVMRELYFLNFWLLTVFTTVIFCSINPLIELWLGKKMLFEVPKVFVIVLSFYLSCIRDPVQLFLQGYGIFEQTKFINPIRALVNLTLSVLLINKFGITGVFLGTVVSVVAVPLWSEVYVLYKYGFKTSPEKFYKEMYFYIICSFVICTLSYVCTHNIPHTIKGVIVRVVLSFVISNTVVVVLFGKSVYLKNAHDLLKRFFKFN